MAAERKMANAMGGMTARPCDGCLKKRARWYCVADDAFLCQGCDASVHSANQLASRHQRVRLETALAKPNAVVLNSDDAAVPAPAWHQGFTRKARTPRHNKSSTVQHKEEGKVLNLNPMDPLVPEIGNEEGPVEENEEHLLCRVPEFDPFSAMENEHENMVIMDGYGDEGMCELDGLNEFLPSDVDLAEFVADVENLLGGDDEDNCDIKMKGLLLDCKEETKNTYVEYGEKTVKVKEEELEVVSAACFLDSVGKMNLDCESPMTREEEEKAVRATERSSGESRNIFLRLNYEAVISAWASQGSPWTTGSRPNFNPNDGWPDYKVMYPNDGHHLAGSTGGAYGQLRGGDGEREARVSRYREKRRTRLFSKKIRYEVRKLNAEKRPRMKGRFVKRTSFVGISSFPYNNQ
ncbi:hypothetical protein SLA2020_161970 [Shorea laevis]